MKGDVTSDLLLPLVGALLEEVGIGGAEVAGDDLVDIEGDLGEGGEGCGGGVFVAFHGDRDGVFVGAGDVGVEEHEGAGAGADEVADELIDQPRGGGVGFGGAGSEGRGMGCVAGAGALADDGEDRAAGRAAAGVVDGVDEAVPPGAVLAVQVSLALRADHADGTAGAVVDEVLVLDLPSVVVIDAEAGAESVEVGGGGGRKGEREKFGFDQHLAEGVDLDFLCVVSPVDQPPVVLGGHELELVVVEIAEWGGESLATAGVLVDPAEQFARDTPGEVVLVVAVDGVEGNAGVFEHAAEGGERADLVSDIDLAAFEGTHGGIGRFAPVHQEGEDVEREEGAAARGRAFELRGQVGGLFPGLGNLVPVEEGHGLEEAGDVWVLGVQQGGVGEGQEWGRHG